MLQHAFNSDFLKVYVDNTRVGMVIHPTETSSTPNDGIDPPEVAIGCHVVNDPKTYTNFSNGKFDEVVFWMHRLNDTDNNCFLGGYGKWDKNPVYCVLRTSHMTRWFRAPILVETSNSFGR